MDWNISFFNPDTNKKFALLLVSSIEITKDAFSLADTADIILPESILNRVLDFENKIKRGTQVTIQLGYNGNLKTEFIGYIKEIPSDNAQLKIVCEDALFLFRKSVANKEFKNPKIADIAQYLIDEIDSSFTLVCDYDLSYEKFTIYTASAFEVLKKLSEETKANIYFNTEKKELHIHMPYLQKGGEVIYDVSKNVENINLEYKRAIDRKIEVNIETTNSKGQIVAVKKGSTGGDQINIKVGSMSEADLSKIAEAELSKRSADAFEGSIDTWLLPYCEPTFTAKYRDSDYPEKNGSYYVPKVITKFSEAGASRSVFFDKKLSA